jgi:hypothetical protein
MIDLTHTLSVEYADRYSDGCAWHKDPDCLCDVVVTNPMGDDAYVVPPDMSERFRESAAAREGGDDGWFFDSWDTVVGDTMLANLRQYTAEHVLYLCESRPELIEDLMAHEYGSLEALGQKHGIEDHTLLGDLARFLNLPEKGQLADGKRQKVIRNECVRLYDEGMSTTEIRALMHERYGLDLSRPVVAKWMQRYSQRYATEKPEKSLLKQVAA